MVKKIKKYFQTAKNIYSKAQNKIQRFISKKFCTKYLTFEVAELFFQHNGKEDFLRYDMIVRLLAVENYFGKNDFGFDMYCRMQGYRKKPEYIDKSVNKFKELIASYDSNGYDKSSEIELDSTLHLIDGSHRMALAMYYNIKTISAKVRAYQLDVFYSIEWFKVNGFSDDECKILKNRYIQLKEHYQQPFVCTLWSPVADFYDKIIENLALFGKIVEVKKCDFNEWDYKFYTRGVYAVDDIEKWKIEKKLSYMIDCKNDVYHICIVSLLIEQPDFRLKATNQKTLSKKCEVIKSVIRNAYKTKLEKYYHDIVLHIGDNFYQNQHIHRLFTMPQIDVTSILDSISNCGYVITKMDVDYMPDNFPQKYPLGKDLDIVCANNEEYNKVLQSITKQVAAYNDSYTIRFVSKKDKFGSENRTLIRMEQGNYLVYQCDISYQMETIMSEDFVQGMIKKRMKVKNYYVPTIPYEIIIRINELHAYPHKIQHKKYLQSYLDKLDENLCNTYLKYNWKKIIKYLNDTTENNSRNRL